jgi:hypothetical protein
VVRRKAIREKLQAREEEEGVDLVRCSPKAWQACSTRPRGQCRVRGSSPSSVGRLLHRRPFLPIVGCLLHRRLHDADAAIDGHTVLAPSTKRGWGAALWMVEAARAGGSPAPGGAGQLQC